MAFQISSPLEGIAGVYWTIFMHAIVLIANILTIRTARAECRKSKTRFWVGCSFISLALLAPSIHAILLGFQVVTELIGRGPYLPIIGNATARIGMMVVTILRFYRLRVISEHPKRQRKFIVNSTIVAILMLTSTVTTIWWVVEEEANWHLTNGNQVGAPPSLLMIRNLEGIYGFCAFFVTAAFNVVADYRFVCTIVEIRKGAMGDAIVRQGKTVFVKTYLAYLPTLIHFAICTVLGSLFISGSPANYLTYVSISHYTAMPATLLFTFVHSTIPATKSLVQRVSRQGSTTSRGKRSRGSVNSGKPSATLVASMTGATSGVGRGSIGPSSTHATLIGHEGGDRQHSISASPSESGSLSSRAGIMPKK